jgi:PTS system nitrogen regulatory IIA component
MLLTAGSAATLLGTSERQIYRWVDDGEIPCRRVRDQLRFNRTDLLEWASSRRLPVHVEAFAEDDPKEHPPSLGEALRVGRVHAEIESGSRDALVHALVARLLPETADRELVSEVLLARSAAGFTAIGSGLAIPQVRNPIVVAGQAPLVAVCHLATPLALGGSADGLPVRTLFFAVSPTIRCHLQLLARLSRALVDVEFLAAAKSHAPLDEVIRHAARIEAEPRRDTVDDENGSE